MVVLQCMRNFYADDHTMAMQNMGVHAPRLRCSEDRLVALHPGPGELSWEDALAASEGATSPGKAAGCPATEDTAGRDR